MRSIKLFTAFALSCGLAIGLFSHTVVAQTAEVLDLKDDTSPLSKIKPGKGQNVLGDVPVSELVTATTYPMTNPGAVLEDMSTGTTQLIGPSTDDSNSILVNIGFDFWFDGVRFTQFGVNGNGFARLGAASTGTSFTNSIGTTTNAPKIMPYWDDLCVGTTGKVHFKTIGTAPNRKLVVEFQNMQITRGAGCAGVGTGTFQLWLFESAGASNQGAIQFVYGALPASAAVDGGYSVGLQSGAATNFASVTTSANTVSYAAANNTQTTAIAAGSSYLFTSNVPTAPTGLTFSPVTATSIQLNWTDTAINEVGYVIYRSTDGVNFSFVSQIAAGSTTFTDTLLTPSTNYFYQVYAVTEGALSSALAGSQATAAPGAISCVAPGGDWNNPATWSAGIPTASDNVTIGAGCTVNINTAAVAFGVTVATGGILQYDPAAAQTLTVGGGVNIAAGGTFQSAATGTVTTHVLTLGGNLVNDGTLDFSTNADTAGAGITFGAGASNVTWSGTGATNDVRAVTVAKGAQATVVEITSTNFTVRGVTTDVAGYLTLTSGTFKISGTFTVTNRTFATATYVIPVLGGIWLNNPNYTVAGQAGGTTCANNGLFRMTQGVYNIGLTGADGMGGGAGANFIIENGTINATRIDPQNAVIWNMSNGTINISPTTGNTRSNFGSFELFSTTSSFTMSGGTINLIQAAVAATPIDWQVLSNPATITGGVINVGTAATATNFNFRLRGTTPSIVIDNTANNKTATFTAQTLIRGNTTVNPGTTFAINGFLVAPTAEAGATRTFTNNGTITGNTAGSRLYWLGTGAGSGHIYTGSGIAGTTVAPLLSVDFDSVNGVNLSGAASNLITNRVILFTGNVTGSAKLELGVGGASTGTTQIGNTTTATNAGVFDGPFTFNLGTGGQVASYLRTTTSYTTGGEVNIPNRTLTTMTVDNNVTSLNIGGGNIFVTGTMTLTNGTVFTGNANTLVHNGTAARTNGFVDGNLGRDFSAPGVYTFFVGQGAFTPVLANVTAAGAGSRLTARSFNATLAGFNPPTSLSRNWSLEEDGTITADLSFTYDVDANDVNGNEADYRVFSRDSANVVTNHCSGGPCVNVGTNTLGPIIGVTSFSRWTGAENQIPVAANAYISGRVTTSGGNGIRNAIVTLSGGNLPLPLSVQTGAFGYYSFENLQVGESYVLQVGAKRFRFAVSSRIITLQDNLEDIDFVANPQD